MHIHYINSDKAKMYNHGTYMQIIIKNFLFTCCPLRHFYKKNFYSLAALWDTLLKKISGKYKKNFIHLLHFETLL